MGNGLKISMEAVGVGLLIAGIVFFVAGMWLIWDLMNTVIHTVSKIDWQKFCEIFRFYAPFFIYMWTCETWSGSFDLGLTLAGAGIIIGLLGAYLIGYSRE